MNPYGFNHFCVFVQKHFCLFHPILLKLVFHEVSLSVNNKHAYSIFSMKKVLFSAFASRKKAEEESIEFHFVFQARSN